MDKIVTLKKFGRLVLEGETYVLLRPLPFLPEYYEEYPGRKFYVAYYDETYTPTAYNPHYLTVSDSCKYYIDFSNGKQDIEVRIYEGQEMEDIPEEIEANMRPIDLIAESDDELTVKETI